MYKLFLPLKSGHINTNHKLFGVYTPDEYDLMEPWEVAKREGIEFQMEEFISWADARSRRKEIFNQLR
jgi:hypothetical protein